MGLQLPRRGPAEVHDRERDLGSSLNENGGSETGRRFVLSRKPSPLPSPIRWEREKLLQRWEKKSPPNFAPKLLFLLLGFQLLLQLIDFRANDDLAVGGVLVGVVIILVIILGFVEVGQR